MKKFKKDTWVYNGENRIERVTFLTAELEWEDVWNELKNVPDRTLNVKTKTLDEVEPKVGMNVKHRTTGTLATIVVVADNSVCLQLKDVRENEDKEAHELRVVSRSAYTCYKVSSEENVNIPIPKLTVAGSLSGKYAGRTGMWKTRGGFILYGQLTKAIVVCNAGTKWLIASNGYDANGYHSGGTPTAVKLDLVEFLGWEDEQCG